MSKNKEIEDLFNHWNNADLVTHRRLDKVMRNVISNVLKEYPIEELKEAIDLYAKVLNHPNSRWTYKWRIEEFFKRTPGFRHFLPESKPLEKFLRAGNSWGQGDVTPPASPVSPAHKEQFLQEKQAMQRERDYGKH
jgi:hypothetical protein